VGVHPLDPHDPAIDGRADVSADAGGAGSGDAGVGEVRVAISGCIRLREARHYWSDEECQDIKKIIGGKNGNDI